MTEQISTTTATAAAKAAFVEGQSSEQPPCAACTARWEATQAGRRVRHDGAALVVEVRVPSPAPEPGGRPDGLVSVDVKKSSQ